MNSCAVTIKEISPKLGIKCITFFQLKTFRVSDSNKEHNLQKKALDNISVIKENGIFSFFKNYTARPKQQVPKLYRQHKQYAVPKHSK
jgi:hypothetical protein